MAECQKSGNYVKEIAFSMKNIELKLLNKIMFEILINRKANDNFN